MTAEMEKHEKSKHDSKQQKHTLTNDDTHTTIKHSTKHSNQRTNAFIQGSRNNKCTYRCIVVSFCCHVVTMVDDVAGDCVFQVKVRIDCVFSALSVPPSHIFFIE